MCGHVRCQFALFQSNEARQDGNRESARIVSVNVYAPSALQRCDPRHNSRTGHVGFVVPVNGRMTTGDDHFGASWRDGTPLDPLSCEMPTSDLFVATSSAMK